MPDFTIRPACESDSEFLGWVVLTAARGHLARGWFDVALERDEAFCRAYCARLATTQARSCWHHSIFSIAEVDGAPASALCGIAGPSIYEACDPAMEEASRALGLSEEQHAQLWPRGEFIMSCITGEEGAWTIDNVATLPAHRGRGLVQALLDDELARAHAEGYARAQISFLIGNKPAERAYRYAGFAFAEDATSPEFEAAMGVPGLRRLARDI